MRLDFAYCIPRELSKFTSGGVVQRYTWHLLDYSLDMTWWFIEVMDQSAYDLFLENRWLTDQNFEMFIDLQN